MNTLDLDGKRAVITGDARGMGFAIARRFMDSGASVALWDISADTLDNARKTLSGSGSVTSQVVDVANYVSVEEISAMVGWLCSEECSYSTGAVFDLSGGRATY